MIDFTRKERYNFEDLQQIMHLLRAPGGCPWDREQTHESILRNFQEETYEFCEAALEDDRAHMIEELGDVLMQVAFHTCIEEERGRFTMDDVCDGVCKKLIFRHPHVFGSEVTCRTSDEVLTTWDQVKRQEKDQKTVTDTLNAVARTLPALWRAEKITRKAAKAGVSYASALQALDGLEETLQTLRASVMQGSGVQQALGDLLFSASCLSGMLEQDPEQALHAACERFIARFDALEQAAGANALETMTREELAKLWAVAKAQAARAVQENEKE